MAKCYVCGATEADRDTWRFCSVKRKFICKQCEEQCNNYSKNLLPNGQHCKRGYFSISSYLVSPEVINDNRAKYDRMDTLTLISCIDEMRRRYVRCKETDVRRSYQIRLAAAQTVLEERKSTIQ